MLEPRYGFYRFVVIDSEMDPVLNVVTWQQLRQRWRYHDVDYTKSKPPVLYDLMAVVPRFRVTVTAITQDTGLERSAVSGAEGKFTIPTLVPCSSRGFAP